jgi:hypothetical protein
MNEGGGGEGALKEIQNTPCLKSSTGNIARPLNSKDSSEFHSSSSSDEGKFEFKAIPGWKGNENQQQKEGY